MLCSDGFSVYVLAIAFVVIYRDAIRSVSPSLEVAATTLRTGEEEA